jgi:hypothetical protein
MQAMFGLPPRRIEVWSQIFSVNTPPQGFDLGGTHTILFHDHFNEGKLTID